MPSNSSLRIVSFQASNFKKLTAVLITPTGDVITLAGENGAGKSSVLDGIESTIAGNRCLPEKPIRDGATKGFTETVLSNGLKLTKTYTASGAVLKVEDGSGNPCRSPQALLDKLYGAYAFDPVAFSRLKPVEQRETLQALVGLDFTKWDKDRKKYFDERTVVNRDLDRLTTLLTTMVPTHEGVADEETSAASVLVALSRAEQYNKNVDAAISKAQLAGDGVLKMELEVAHAKSQIEAWKKVLGESEIRLGQAKHIAELAKTELGAMEKTDLQGIRDKLVTLEMENLKVRQNIQRRKYKQELADVGAKSKNLTTMIDGIDELKVEALRKAKFPLPGLTFDESGVFYNRIPFSQASDGEKLRISVAMGMALNPELKVIFVRNGQFLDKSGLALVAEMAEANKYQIWLEDNRSTDPAAIIIEDGHIKGKE